MKILVPIDGSEFSKHSIEFVTSRATLLGHNPEIELLSVQAPVPAQGAISPVTEMAKAIPMRRLADPLEVGELAAFLASDESSYLTGTQNVIDGGSTLPETVSVGI